MKIYVVGAPEKKFFKFDESREKYLINDKHEGENIDNYTKSLTEGKIKGPVCEILRAKIGVRGPSEAIAHRHIQMI